MNTFGVIPTYEERQRRPVPWRVLFTEDKIAWVAAVVTIDAGHRACGGWWMDAGSADLVCACGETLFRLEAVS